jgi:PAS domain-containing protein
VAGAARLATDTSSQAEAKYRTLVETLPLVVHVDSLDEVSSNLYTSPQTTELLGYTPDEWYGEHELFARALHPENRERVPRRAPPRQRARRAA